jgi:hypothetical protein
MDDISSGVERWATDRQSLTCPCRRLMRLGRIWLHDPALDPNLPPLPARIPIPLSRSLRDDRVSRLFKLDPGSRGSGGYPSFFLFQRSLFLVQLFSESLSLFSRVDYPVIMVEHGYREGLFGFILSDDVFVQVVRYLHGYRIEPMISCDVQGSCIAYPKDDWTVWTHIARTLHPNPIPGHKPVLPLETRRSQPPRAII